jgi:mannose-6-phosphate isomerase-like protein (cupin superfamily)
MQIPRVSFIVISFLTVVTFVSPLLAQEPHPTCDHCQATYVPKSELDAYFQQAKDHNIVDQQVRNVDLGHMQVGIGTVYRKTLLPGAPSDVAEHEQVSEVYYIIEGGGTIKTGPDLVGAEKRPSNLLTVVQQNGPGYNAKSITDPMTTEVRAGDVLIIPAGTGHWWTSIPDHVTYLMVRLDPDKLLPLKSEAQSKAHMAKPYHEGQDNY